MAPQDHHYLPLSLDEVQGIASSPNHALTYVCLSIGSFLLSKSILTGSAPPQAKCQGPSTVWKWVNTANSLVHSVVTGIGSAICVYLHPRVAENVIATYSDYSHRLVSFSVGYFLFDFADMLANHRKRSSYELMAHHVFVLSCFILSVATRYYLAFTIISLVVEVNSIFLHWRQLLLITRVPKSSTYYRAISGVNLVTFVSFRIAVLGWMTRWLSINRRLVRAAPYILGCVSVGGLLLMSIVLLIRLLKADFQVVVTPAAASNRTLPPDKVEGASNGSKKRDGSSSSSSSNGSTCLPANGLNNNNKRCSNGNSFTKAQ